MPGDVRPISFRPGQRERQLGQVRPTDLLNWVLYTPGAGIRGVITTLFICPNAGTAPNFWIYHDDDGTTYDATTIIYRQEATTANTTRKIPFNTPDGLAVANGGNVAVATSVANELTFTAYGYEVIED